MMQIHNARDLPSLKQAYTNLLPLLMCQRTGKYLSWFDKSLLSDEMITQAVTYLENIIYKTNDPELLHAYQRDKLIIETLEQLTSLCNIPFGFLDLGEELLPTGREMIDGFGLQETVRNEVMRIEKMIENLEGEKREAAADLLWQLRLLFSKDGTKPLLLFHRQHYTEALQHLPDWVTPDGSVCPEISNFELWNCAYRQETRNLYLDDMKSLLARIHQRLCERRLEILEKQALDPVSPLRFSFFDIKSHLETCVAINPKSEQTAGLFEHVVNQLQQVAGAMAATDKFLNKRYTIAGVLIEFFDYVKQAGQDVANDKLMNAIIEFGLEVSDEMFTIAMRYLKSGDLKNIESKRKFENNVRRHKELLEGLKGVNPRKTRILYYLGEVECMSILLLEPGDNISGEVNRIRIKLDDLQEKAAELGNVYIKIELAQLKSLIEMIQTKRNLHSMPQKFREKFESATRNKPEAVR